MIGTMKIGLAGLALALATSTAFAEEYRASSFLDPLHPISVESFTNWAADLAELTDGRLDFEIFFGGSLLPGKETMDGIGAGVAQAGFIVSPYTPSKLPIGNSVAHYAWQHPDKYVLAGAYADWMMNDPVASQEWFNANNIYGVGFSTPAYYMLCSTTLRTAADFQGIRVRTPGAAYPGFVAALGGVDVNVSSTETYDAMDKGALDCMAGDITQLTHNAKILDLVEGVTLIPMGPSFIGAAHVYNLDWYSGLSEEDRRNLWNAAARSMARQQILYTSLEDGAFEAAKTAGIEIIEPDETLEAALQSYIDGGMGAVESAEKYGVQNPEEVFASFEPYLEKWEGLVAGLQNRRDVDELTKLFSENIYDRVDVSSYGMK